MREIRCAIELREDSSRMSPGRLTGVLLTYEERAVDRAERFAAGSLSWDSSGVVLNRAHDRRRPIMRFVPLVEGREIRIDAELPDSPSGREAATEIRNGLFRGLSVEFEAIEESEIGGVREIRAARLVGAGLVDAGAYATSVSVRGRSVLPWWI